MQGDALSIIGLRTQYDERGDFRVSTTPAILVLPAAGASDYLLGQIALGAGYTTEFIVMPQASGGANASRARVLE